MYCLIKFALPVVAALATGVKGVYSGDWTSEKWDIIVVGAGPAGIIGEFDE